MSVYSDKAFARQNGLAVSDIRESPHIQIERSQGELSFQPSSVDLHLGGQFLEMKERDGSIKVDQRSSYPSYQFETPNDDGYYEIEPNEFVLATTQETVSLDDTVVGFLWGRSSVGRLGLFVENAGLIDAGYDGELTLELFNPTDNTIAVKPGMRIVQMTVHELTEPSAEAYDEQVESKYNEQSGVTPSRLFKDFD